MLQRHVIDVPKSCWLIHRGLNHPLSNCNIIGTLLMYQLYMMIYIYNTIRISIINIYQYLLYMMIDIDRWYTKPMGIGIPNDIRAITVI